MEALTGFVGRDAALAEALEALRSGHSVVIKGRAGMGKRALLRQVRQRLEGERPCLWPSMTTPKSMVEDLAEQVHEQLGLVVPERYIPPRFRAEAHRTGRVPWQRIGRSLRREPAREVLALILASVRDRQVILFTETLEVPPTQAAMLHELAEVCQLASALDEENRRVRILRLLWGFQRTIELGPLTRAETRTLVERWLEERPIDFATPSLRERFIAAVVQDSGGVPAAIEGMLQSASNDREVTPARLRDYRHEAAAVYWDMTPLLVLGLIGYMAARYISRGIGEAELLVFSGVGSALYWGLVLLVRRLGR